MAFWKNTKKPTDKYLYNVAKILRKKIKFKKARISTPKEDQEECGDLILDESIYISIRLRSEKYYTLYPNDITFRRSTQLFKQTELEKIVDGYGDWFFYGFIKDNKVVGFTLFNLDEFRIWLKKNKNNRKVVKIKLNDDMSSFYVIDRNNINIKNIYKKT